MQRCLLDDFFVGAGYDRCSMTDNGQNKQKLMTIGALSKATDVPPETLRTWERRYGFPKPVRLDSGHRRYVPETVEHIQLVNQALEAGHRPGNVLALSMDDLLELLGEKPQGSDLPLLDQWMLHVTQLQKDKLAHELEQQWFANGALTFLEDVLTPFIRRIGQQWYNGQLAVFHEQFASGVITDFLERQWRPLAEKSAISNKSALLCTLPGEYHAIGLHMVACLLAVAGWQVDMLGTDLEPGTIVNATLDKKPDAVMVSISAASNPTATEKSVHTLHDLLKPIKVPIIIGGGGASFEVSGVDRVQSLRQLFQWAKHPQSEALS